MRKSWRCTNTPVDPYVAMSLALLQYHFSTPEIRLLMRHVLGHALSGRTIKRVERSAGSRLKCSRPRATPKVRMGDVSDLIEATCNGIGAFDVTLSNLF